MKKNKRKIMKMRKMVTMKNDANDENNEERLKMNKKMENQEIEKNQIKYPIEDKLILLMPELHGQVNLK